MAEPIFALLLSVEEQQNEQQRDAREQHKERKNERPLHFISQNIRRVAQGLHNRADESVIDEIKSDVQTVGFFWIFPRVDEQENRDDEIDKTFIEKESIVPRPAGNIAVAAEDFFKSKDKSL